VKCSKLDLPRTRDLHHSQQILESDTSSGPGPTRNMPWVVSALVRVFIARYFCVYRIYRKRISLFFCCFPSSEALEQCLCAPFSPLLGGRGLTPLLILLRGKVSTFLQSRTSVSVSVELGSAPLSLKVLARKPVRISASSHLTQYKCSPPAAQQASPCHL
jgi:hypothetical protein